MKGVVVFARLSETQKFCINQVVEGYCKIYIIIMKDSQAEIWHYRCLVSKETVVQHQWESETFALLNE